LWKIISDRQENFWWWKSIVDNLSKDLKHEFGERSWYSVQNLWYMKKFYDSTRKI
jgi:IS1 family transposase